MDLIDMTYSYYFDDKTVGNMALQPSDWKILHSALQLLNDELMHWNQKVGDVGAQKMPYEQEVQDIDRIMRSIRNKIKCSSQSQYDDLTEKGVSLGSQSLLRAALTLLLCRQSQNFEDKKNAGWPSAALDSLSEEIKPIKELLREEQLSYEPHEVLWQLISREQSMECQSQLEPA